MPAADTWSDRSRRVLQVLGDQPVAARLTSWSTQPNGARRCWWELLGGLALFGALHRRRQPGRSRTRRHRTAQRPRHPGGRAVAARAGRRVAQRLAGAASGPADSRQLRVRVHLHRQRPRPADLALRQTSGDLPVGPQLVPGAQRHRDGVLPVLSGRAAAPAARRDRLLRHRAARPELGLLGLAAGAERQPAGRDAVPAHRVGGLGEHRARLHLGSPLAAGRERAARAAHRVRGDGHRQPLSARRRGRCRARCGSQSRS